MKKLYVGNLPFNTDETDLRELFEAYGEVTSVQMISDRETGKFRGFAFVEMDSGAADEAVSALNGKDFNGRELKVNEARPRENRPDNRYQQPRSDNRNRYPQSNRGGGNRGGSDRYSRDRW